MKNRPWHHPRFVTWTDDFITSNLNSRWHWIRQDPTHWSLSAKSGFLQIMTEETFDSIPTTKNLLVQNAPIRDYSIETKLEFTPTQNWQLAGLLIYLNDYNWVQIGRAFCTPNLLINCVGDGVYFDYYHNGYLVEPGKIKLAVAMPPQPDVYLRITRHGFQFTGYMSLEGTDWEQLGVHTIVFSPTWIGLKASNQPQLDSQIPANFDYFTLLDYSFYISI